MDSLRTLPGRSSLVRYGGYAFSVGGARVIGLLITSATFPYLVRRLGVEMYARWSYTVALCSFLELIADPGITNYATQRVAAHREQAFPVIPDVLFLRVLCSALAVAVLTLITSLEPRHDVRWLLRVYGIGILLVNLISADHFLTSLELFHLRSTLTVIQQALYAAGIFCFVRSPQNVIWLPASLLASVLVAGLAGWVILARHGLRWSLRVQPGNWKEIAVPSIHYASATLMSNVYHRSGHLLVRWFIGDYALGLYAAAARMVDVLRGFVIVGLQVLMPRLALSSRSQAELRRLAALAIAGIALISIPITVGLIGTAHLLVPWLLGSQYVAAVPLVKWMAPYLITASAASLLAGTILYSAGLHRAYFAATASGAVAGVCLYLILMPSLGLKGAAMALVLAEFVVAAVAYRSLPLLRGAWKNPALAASTVAAILMLVSLWLLSFYTSQIFAVISVGASIYVLACTWFVRKIVTQRESVSPSTT